MGSKQRQLISEAKLRIRGIGKEIADLVDERVCLKLLIAQDKYISDTYRKRLSHRMAQRVYEGKKKIKKDMLKAAIDGC